MKKIFYFVFIGTLIVSLGCSKNEKQKEAEELAEQTEKMGEQMEEKMGKGAKSMSEAMKQMSEVFSGDEDVETIDFRELKKMLPKELPGMERLSARGEHNKTFGINVSRAQAEYQAEDGSRTQIKITDMGSMRGLTAFATLAWTMAEFDRETDHGYEKTTSFAGYKAFEEYDNDSRRGRIQTIVEKRFLVEVDGYDVEMAVVKSAMNIIDFRKLESMKMYGLKE